MNTRLDKAFYLQDALLVAPQLVGKLLVHGDRRLRITETEVYRGVEDTACHAHRGRTARTELLFHEGGISYVYLCYGMHSLMNVITGETEQPQGVLIRACEGYDGPGKLTRKLGIDRSINGLPLYGSNAPVWIESDGYACSLSLDRRVGIAYADEADRERLWRFKEDKR